MGNISSYGTRTAVSSTDRIFIASGTSDVIQSATLAQVDSLFGEGSDSGSGSGGGGGSGLPAYLPGIGAGIVGGAWQRPALSAFTVKNASNSVVTELTGGPINVTKTAAGYEDFTMLAEAVPGPAFTGEYLISASGWPNEPSYISILLLNAATGAFVTWGCFTDGTPGTLSLDNWTGFGSSSGSSRSNITGVVRADGSSLITLKVTCDGTNLNFYYSADGLLASSFSRVTNLNATTLASFLGTVTHVGVGLDGRSGQPTTLNLWARSLTSP